MVVFALRFKTVITCSLLLGGVGIYKLAAVVDDRFNRDVSFSTDFGFQPANGRALGRIYLFHGLRASSAYWRQDPYNILTFALRHSGYELIAVDLPYVRRAHFVDSGELYCTAFRSSIQRIITAVDAKHGKALQQLALGVSWGGLHAMIAANHFGMFERFVAVAPVTSIGSVHD